MATYTSSVMSGQPRRVHAGVNDVWGSFNLGATTSSVGDVIFLAKIPTGARILSVRADHSTGSTALGASYGLATGTTSGGGASYSAFVASGAQATILNAAAGTLPFTVSVSDNDPNKYGIFAAKVESGTMTTSLIVNFVVTYAVDQQIG